MELHRKLLRLLQRSDPRDGSDCSSPAEQVDALLTWLEQHGHLSDARFTESRVHARQPRFGNRRIQQELQQHGLRLDAQAQQALVGSEFERACVVWRRKYGSLAEDAAGRVRQMRFLAGRGFSMHVVNQVVRQGGLRSDDNAAGGESG